MKYLTNAITGLAICAGLVLTGAEANNLIHQVFASVGGVLLFTIGCLGFCYINKEGDND